MSLLATPLSRPVAFEIVLKNKRGKSGREIPNTPIPWVLTFVMAAMPPTEGQKMRHKPLLTPTMRLILTAHETSHQPLSRAMFVELTRPASSTALLSIGKLHHNGIIITGTNDGITQYEISDPTPAAATAVAR